MFFVVCGWFSQLVLDIVRCVGCTGKENVDLEKSVECIMTVNCGNLLPLVSSIVMTLSSNINFFAYFTFLKFSTFWLLEVELSLFRVLQPCFSCHVS